MRALEMLLGCEKNLLVFTYAREYAYGIRVDMTYALALKSKKHDPLSGKGRKPQLRPVTGRQLQVLVYLRRYIASYRCSPVIREVCSFFGFCSPQGGLRHLQALVRKGMTVPLVGGNGCSRGYELTAAGLAATDHFELGPLPAPTPIQAKSQRRRRQAAC